MKINYLVLKPAVVFATTLVWCALNLQAQDAPTASIQPGSQTNVAGTTVTFTVAVTGTGPFGYQWQFNGTNLPGVITTVAGNGTGAYSGDGGPATNASLWNPQGMAWDAAGNLYFADQNNNRIRKLDTNGIIITVAGNGTAGTSGDHGAATNANLYGPCDVAFDAAGNLYIAGNFDPRVRRVDTNGVITTVAGNGVQGSGAPDNAATNTALTGPVGVAFDAAGNLYLAENRDNRILKVGTNGILTKVAGNSINVNFGGDGGQATNALLGFPIGVALDATGNLYIGDYANMRIRKVGTNGIISTVAGSGGFFGSGSFSGDGGPANKAGLAYPTRLTFDAAGNMFIDDNTNHRIRKVGTNGIISTVAGNGTAAYSGDGGPATAASLNYPFGVAVDALGNLYIGDSDNNCIRLVRGYPTFTLANVSPTNAGNYTVVVTSPYGSVTSDAVTLTVTVPTTPPQIIAGDSSFGFQANHFGFNLGGASGQTIIVDGSADLVIWTPLFTNLVTGSPFYFFDPFSTNFPSRYYRARLP